MQLANWKEDQEGALKFKEAITVSGYQLWNQGI
jgi:hypothetical protein